MCDIIVAYEAFAYDGPGTDLGNKYKAIKPLESYDEDCKLAIDYLTSLPTCNGKIGATGMCLGGHIALRAAFDPRVKSAVTFFGTDVHSNSLGTTNDQGLHSLERIKKGHLGGPSDTELITIYGTLDPHVPAEGRDLIRKTLRDAGAFFTFFEVAGAQHAFVRDEESKGRYDPAVTSLGLTLLYELFHRTLTLDLGQANTDPVKVDDVC